MSSPSPSPAAPTRTSTSGLQQSLSPSTATDQNKEQLKTTIARQAETIDSLHAAAAKYRTRLAALEQQLTVKQAEIDSQKVLAQENAALRAEQHHLREKLREVELNNSRLAESATLESENQAQLGVKVQAYQRHNTFLQGEVALREAKLKALQEQIDVLAEEVHTKDRRITILVEKLRQHNIDPTSSVAKISVPEASYAEMKEKLSTQSTTIELLREKLETAQEDAVRRDSVIEAQARENKALKGSISRLIAQINGTAAAGARSTSEPTADVESKLKAYHQRRLADYTSPPRSGSS